MQGQPYGFIGSSRAVLSPINDSGSKLWQAVSSGAHHPVLFTSCRMRFNAVDIVGTLIFDSEWGSTFTQQQRGGSLYHDMLASIYQC